MTDVATLGFSVNTAAIKAGVQDLSSIAAAAQNVEKHTTNLEKAFIELGQSGAQLKNVSQQFPQMAEQVRKVDSSMQSLSATMTSLTATTGRLRDITAALQSIATVGRDVHTTLDQIETTLTGLAAATTAIKGLANEFLPAHKATLALIDALQRLESAFKMLQGISATLRELANQFFPLQKNMADTTTTAQRMAAVLQQAFSFIGSAAVMAANAMSAAFGAAFDIINAGTRLVVSGFNVLKENSWIVELALAGIKEGAKGVGSELADMATDFLTTADAAEETSSAIDTLVQGLALLGIGLGFKELMNYTDVFGRVSVQLGQATNSQLAYTESLSALYTMAQKTGQEFEGTAQMYSRMARATAELGISQSQLLDVTEMVNQMLMTAQLPAASASAALFQFSQAMSSGVLRGEELNSVMEQMPPLAKAIADGMGIGMGQLRKFAAEGALTSSNVLAALMNQKGAINEQFEAMMGGATTMSNLMSRADSAMVMLVGRADELSGFSEAIGEAFAAITKGIESTEVLNAVTTVFTVLPMIIMPAVDALRLVIDWWQELATVILTYEIAAIFMKSFVIFKEIAVVISVATKAWALYKAATAAATAVILANSAAITTFMSQFMSLAAAQQVVSGLSTAFTFLGAAIKAFLIQLGVITAVGVAIGLLVSYFMMASNAADASQKAMEAHDAVLKKLGYTADETAEKFKKMNEEQQKLTIQELELSISLNKKSIDETLKEIRGEIGDLLNDYGAQGNAFDMEDPITAKTLALFEKLNEAMKKGGTGLASLMDEMKKANIVTDKQQQALLKQIGTLEAHKEALGDDEARLRILTNTMRGDEEARLGRNQVLKVELGMISKLTEEWIKYIAKQKEAAQTFGMNPMELAADKGQDAKRNDWAIQEAVALAELQVRYKEYQDAVQANNAAGAVAAKQSAESAEARRIEAIGMQALIDEQSRLNEVGTSGWEVQVRAQQAAQKAMDMAKEQINVQQTLARVEREAAEARQKAYEAGEKAAQQSIENALAMAEAWGQGSKAAREMEAHLKAVDRAKTESAVPASGVISSSSLDINALVQAIIKIESAGRANAVSSKGATGLMQVMPGTAQYLGYSPSDMLDPTKNVAAGTKYIQMMLDRYVDKATGEFNVDKALAAYNAGPGNVDKHGGIPPFKETQEYVVKVKAAYSQIKLEQQELAKLDADALQKGAQKVTQLKEQTDLVKLQTQLLESQYTNVQTADGVLISADKIRASMDMLKSYGLTQGQAADAVTKAIEATQGQTNAQQAMLIVEEQLKSAVAGRVQASAAATLEAQKQTQVIAEQVVAMKTQAQAIDDLNRDGQVMLTATVTGTGQVIDAGLATSKEAVETYYQLIEKVNAEVKTLTEQGASGSAINDRVNQTVGKFNQEQLKKITDTTARLEDQRKELELNAPSWAELTGQVEANNTVQETTAALNKIVTVGMQSEAEAQKALTMEKAKAVEEAKKLQAAQSLAAEGYKNSLTPMEKYAAEMKKIADAEKILLANKDKYTGEEWTQMQRGIAKAREEAELLKLEADPMAQAFKSAAEGIYNAWGEMWEGLFTQGISSFSDVVEQIKTMFLKMIAQMAAAALAKPILLPIVQTMGGVMGLDSGTMAPIVNNIFGAGTMGAGGASGGGLGSITDMLGLGNLFGGGGSMVNGAASFAAGLGGIAGAGSMVAGASSFASGIGAAWTGASALSSAGGIMGGIGSAMGAISAAVPVIGAVVGIVGMLSGLFEDTPHPHAYVQSGQDDLWTEGREGTIRQGASGMDYGLVYGDVEEQDAIDMRDAFLEMDKALTSIIPTVDLAGVKMGAFGASGGGYIAAINGVETAVGSMDEATSAFVQEWVKRAADVGATSRLVSDALYGMTGTADELIAAFAILQGMDAAGNLNQQIIDIARAADAGTADLAATLTALASVQGYIVADPLGEFEEALAESLKTTFDRLGEAGQALADGMAEVNWTDSASIQELAGLIESRYAMEAQMIMEIQGYLESVTASFGSSIEEIQLSVMSNAEKYDYYSQQAAAAAEALKTATDPADIAALAEEARAAAMSAYGLLDESQKGAVSDEFIGFLEATQQTATDQLNAAQQTVLDQHQATADLLANALINAGQVAADAIADAAAVLADAVAAMANQYANLGDLFDRTSGALSSAEGMATGGIVGGRWNGKAGIAGDTVATMLTPGEAVISRAQTQKHAALIEAIMADDVRYAASGLPPWSGGSGGGGNPDDPWGPYGGGIGPYEPIQPGEDLAPPTTLGGDRIPVIDWGSIDLEKGFDKVFGNLPDEMKNIADALTELAKGGYAKTQQAEADKIAFENRLATDYEQTKITLNNEFSALSMGLSQQYEAGQISQADYFAGYDQLQALYQGKGKEAEFDYLSALSAGPGAAEDNANALADLIQRYQDILDNTTQFAAALRDLSRQTEDAIEQATEWGATEEQLAVIQAGAAKEEQLLRAEFARQLSDLMQPYQDAIDGGTEFSAALRDMARQTEDALEQAYQLGATEEDLARIREGAAAQEQELRDQYARQLNDLIQPYQDAMDSGTAFERSIRDLNRQTADAVDQARELGATEEQLTQIREGAAAQAAELEKQRRQSLDDLLQPYDDALNQTNAFDQQLRDLARQTADAKEQAAELGATEAELARITEGAAEQERQLREERAKQLTKFMTGFDTGGASEFQQAMAELNRQLTDNLQTATDLGATEEQLAQIRDWTADQAVQAAEAAVQQEIDTYQQAADAVIETLERLTDALDTLRDSVNADLLTLNRANPNWDEVDYQQQRVADLQAELASADSLSLEERIERADELRGAIMDRYAAEMAAIEEQRAALDNMVSIAKNLKQWLDSLKLSDLSTLSPEQKLAEAQQQYQDMLTRAQSGDADAQGQLQSAAEAYLSEARAYFASTEAYAGIFDQVTNTLTALADAWQQQGEGGIDALDDTLTSYEEQALALADAAQQELNALLPLLEKWQAEAQQQADSELAALQTTLNTNTSAIIKALQESGLVTGQKLESALASLAATISAAIAAVASKVTTTSNPVGGAGAFELNGHMTGGVMPYVPSGSSSGFNEAYYLATNPDVAAAVAAGGYSSGLDHYNTIGSYEGRAPAYADGGLASGWSLVGEQGPELVNFTMPGRVYTAADTRMMLAENDSSEDSEAVVVELKALIRLQSEANRQLIKKLDAVESRLAGIESKARLEAAA